MLTTAYAKGTTTTIFPSKGTHATCIDCGGEVISKCGQINADHFAHMPGVVCNTRFHDNKTQWHIDWQHTVEPGLPGVNVEVPIEKDGSIKRADLISKSNCVIEFQHSHLPIDERLEREKHYRNMIWVVHTDREKSKTWLYPTSGVRIFFNGNNDIIHWKRKCAQTGPETFKIKKEKFIKVVINNQHYTNDVFTKIENRARKRVLHTSEYYLRERDERHSTGLRAPGLQYSFFCVPVMSNYYVAMCYLIKELIKLEKYHTDRINSERQAREVFLKDQLVMKDPSLLQALLKSELDMEEDNLITEKSEWVQNTERDLITRNRERHKAQLKVERDRELELAKQINIEIINNQTKKMSNEIQERVRIDLIRVKGNLKYAAEAARERLNRLGIDYNNETGQVIYRGGSI